MVKLTESDYVGSILTASAQANFARRLQGAQGLYGSAERRYHYVSCMLMSCVSAGQSEEYSVHDDGKTAAVCWASVLFLTLLREILSNAYG